jgi:tetratricopeptide (TPR) repeat protein
MNSVGRLASMPRASQLWVSLVVVLLLLAGNVRTAAEQPHAPRAQAFDWDMTQLGDPAPPEDLSLVKESAKKADALAAFSKGLLAEENADTDTALEQYRRVLDLDPTYTELAIKVAYELARRDDVAEGISVLKDAIKASPKEPLTYLYLSQLYSKYLKKPDLALKYANKALNLDPSNFAAYLTIFEIHVANKESEKAEQVLERASQLKTDDPEFWLQLGELSSRLYLHEDGAAEAGKLEKLNAIYQKVLEFAKNDPEVISRVADYYVVSRQVKAAIPLYLDVLELKSDGEEDPSLSSVRDKLARSFLVAGQRKEAIEVLEQIVKENPMRFETYELLGQLYEEEGNLERALASYQQSILLDPAQPLNHLRVAEMLLRLKKYSEAIILLEEARKRFRDLPQITYSLAIALSQAKRHQEALTRFEEALHEAEINNEELLNGTFFFNYGAAAEQAGLLEKSEELLRKAIEMDPSTAAAAYNYLGYMWVDRGQRLEEAGELIRRALQSEPENGAYLDSLGWYYFKKGEYEQALAELLKATKFMEEEDGVVYDHIGDTYHKLGNAAEAISYWRKAAALDPTDKRIAEKIEQVKEKLTSLPPHEKSNLAFPQGSPAP